MDTPAVAPRRQELHPALAAGFGWTFALVFAGVLFSTADPADLGLRQIIGAAVIGLAAFGMPMGALARRHGSRAPSRERLIWTIVVTVTTLILIDQAASVNLASPGELNINTTETMRERQASFDRWGRPPEDVQALIRTVTVIAIGAILASVLSALAGAEPPRGRRFYLLLPVYAAWTAVALGVSAIAGMLAMSVLGGLGAIVYIAGGSLAAGALFALLVSAGREVLLPSTGVSV
jgi:hypothetical protein